jgi:chemotaxis protein CheD
VVTQVTSPSGHPTAVVQGEFRISEDPAGLLSTVLGSCVAVCLHDPVRKIGGMNHFLLPFGQEEGSSRPVRYGLFAMETLIQALLEAGAKVNRLQAKLLGGAQIAADLREIGQINADFARDYLASEGIQCVAESMGGPYARRVVYRPATGQARMMIVPSNIPLAKMRASAQRPLGEAKFALF